MSCGLHAEDNLCNWRRGENKQPGRKQTLFGVNKHSFVYFSLSENKAFEETGTLCQTSYLQGEKKGQRVLRVLEALRGFMSAQCTATGLSFLFVGTEAFSLPKLLSHCLGRCTPSFKQVDSTVCQVGLVEPTMGRVFFFTDCWSESVNWCGWRTVHDR